MLWYVFGRSLFGLSLSATTAAPASSTRPATRAIEPGMNAFTTPSLRGQGNSLRRIILANMRRGMAAGALALALTGAAFAQDFGFRGGFARGPFRLYPNVDYDGRFTFVRVRYSHLPGGNWYGGWPAWAHGYPIAEQNLMRIMNEVSYLSPHLDDITTLTLDDPELFRYPIAYIIEINWWDM